MTDKTYPHAYVRAVEAARDRWYQRFVAAVDDAQKQRDKLDAVRQLLLVLQSDIKYHESTARGTPDIRTENGYVDVMQYVDDMLRAAAEEEEEQ